MNGWHLMLLKLCNSVVEHVSDYLTGLTSRKGGRVILSIIIISVYWVLTLLVTILCFLCDLTHLILMELGNHTIPHFHRRGN